MATAAYTGAVDLFRGGAGFGPRSVEIVAGLPWHSAALAGAGLVAGVAVPMSVCAVLAWCGSRRSGAGALVAGAALITWIVLEAVVVRMYSWMQPTCLVWGLVVAAVGWRILRRGTRHALPPAT